MVTLTLSNAKILVESGLDHDTSTLQYQMHHPMPAEKQHQAILDRLMSHHQN